MLTPCSVGGDRLVKVQCRFSAMHWLRSLLSNIQPLRCTAGRKLLTAEALEGSGVDRKLLASPSKKYAYSKKYSYSPKKTGATLCGC